MLYRLQRGSNGTDITRFSHINIGSRLHMSNEMYHSAPGPVPSLNWALKLIAQMSLYGVTALSAYHCFFGLGLADDYPLSHRNREEHPRGIQDIIDLDGLSLVYETVCREYLSYCCGSFLAGFFFNHVLLFLPLCCVRHDAFIYSSCLIQDLEKD